MKQLARLALMVCLGLGLARAEGAATLVLATEPAGATVLIDGVERGLTPATVMVQLPDDAPRAIHVELRLAGYVSRLASVVVGPGETLVWTGVRLGRGDGAPVLPTELGGAVTAPVSDFPPAGWPSYLAGFRPPRAGLRFRVAEPDGMPQVLIPAGEFVRGSSPADIEAALRLAAQTGDPELERARLESEGPARRIYVSACWLDLHEVSVAQYCRFLNAVKPDDATRKTWLALRAEQKDAPFAPLIEQVGGVYKAFTPEANEYPAAWISYLGAEAYARWAGRRLPTEAEWERAARGGHDGRFFAWEGQAPPPMVGNLCDKSHVERFKQVKKDGRWFVGYEDGFEGLAPVAQFQPNEFGLFDLLGNVWEWCRDGYRADFYATSPARDPVNLEASDLGRVLRGGAFLNAPWSVRPAIRLFAGETVTGVAFGFRCAADG